MPVGTFVLGAVIPVSVSCSIVPSVFMQVFSRHNVISLEEGEFDNDFVMR